MLSIDDKPMPPLQEAPRSAITPAKLCAPSANRVERIGRVVVITPFIGLLLSFFMFWSHGLGAVQLGIFFLMYSITVIGIGVGFHRLFSHRAFETTPPIRLLLAICGSMAAQGPVIFWTATHRRHHGHSDKPGDPHSPHLHGEGSAGMLRGLWHAHTGWMFSGDYTDLQQYARDLLNDRRVFAINRTYFLWILMGLAIPAALGGALTRTWTGALEGFLLGGLARIFFVHHVTWSVNSICHTWGSRSFDGSDRSRNNGWLALLSFGESWHNNHHSYPSAASVRFKWYEIDVCGLVISILSKTRCAWNVKPAPARALKRVA